MVKTLFIDLDGTLIDSHSALFKVYSSFLEIYGKKGSELEFDELKGPSISEIAAILKHRYQLQKTVPELCEDYKNLLRTHYFTFVEFFPHAIETLTYAKSRGYKLVLVTSAERSFVDKILSLKNIFDLIVTADGLQKSKPDPAIYRQALKVSDALPEDVIAIEDSLNGVEAANKAGIRTWRIRHRIGQGVVQISDECLEVDNWKTIHRLLA